MFKKGSCEFSSERSELLLRNFRESIARESKICAMKVFEEIADAPAPRFWVSEARAYRIISMMIKGNCVLDGMHTEKQAMYREIYNRVTEMRRRHPEMPLGDIVFEVVNQPAPSFFLSPYYVRDLIYKYKRSKKRI